MLTRVGLSIYEGAQRQIARHPETVAMNAWIQDCENGIVPLSDIRLDGTRKHRACLFGHCLIYARDYHNFCINTSRTEGVHFVDALERLSELMLGSRRASLKPCPPLFQIAWPKAFSEALHDYKLLRKHSLDSGEIVLAVSQLWLEQGQPRYFLPSSLSFDAEGVVAYTQRVKRMFLQPNVRAALVQPAIKAVAQPVSLNS